MGEAAAATSMHLNDYYGQQFQHSDAGLQPNQSLDGSAAASSSGFLNPLAGSSTSAYMAQDSTNSNGQPAVLRKSCQHCRKRKIKCIPSETDTATCKACVNKGQQCIFEKQATMGRPPKSKKKESDDDGVSPQDHGGTSYTRIRKKKDPASNSDGTATQPKPKKQKTIPSLSRVEATEHAHQYARYSATDQHFPFPSTSATDSPSSALPPTTLPPYGWNSAQSTNPPYSWNTNFQLPLPNVPNPNQYHYPASLQPYSQPLQSDARFDAFPYPSSSAPISSSAEQTSFAPIRSPFSFFPHQQAAPPPIIQQPPVSADSTTATASQIPSQAGQASKRKKSVSPPGSDSSKSAQQGAASDATLPVHRIERTGDLFEAFKTQPLLSLVNAFFDSYTAAPTSRSSPPPLSLADPGVAPIAKMRTLYGKAVSARKPVNKNDKQASADYARAIISPLWDGIPVDIVSLVTTGRPSASGPFGLAGGSSPSLSAGGGSQSQDYLFSKLLREDESKAFAVSHYIDPKDKQSPYLKFAPSKAAVGKYFHGYFSKHPLAPLIVNEKMFVDDLANDRADDLLVNVIIGSAIARGPCLGGGEDARDVGEYFYTYIQNSLLARTTVECLKLETCQALMLWAAHEMAHMRQRRACALWNTADVLLRERNKRHLQAVETRKSSVNPLGLAGPHQAGWRGLVEQELTVNSMWVLNIIHTWAAISLKLPHTAMSVFTNGLSTPPPNAALSTSFQYAYSADLGTNPLPSQHIVRRAIDRFSDVTHLLGVIFAIKNQQQVRNILTPDPPRPMAIANEGNDSQVAAWLLELAQQYKNSPSEPSTQLVTQSSTMSEGSRAFLVVSHAILALYQLLPFAPPSVTEVGMPVPMPTIASLKTALRALHLLSKSITSSSPNTRSRTQALLLDAMPRVISLLDLFTSTSLDSLDHFILVTSHRDMIGELLKELSVACMALETSASGAETQHTIARDNFERARNALQSIAQLGTDLPENKIEPKDDFAMQWSHHEDLDFPSELQPVAPDYHHSSTNTNTGSSESSTPAELYLSAALSNPVDLYSSTNTFQYAPGSTSISPPDGASPADTKPTFLPSPDQAGAHDHQHFSYHANASDFASSFTQSQEDYQYHSPISIGR